MMDSQIKKWDGDVDKLRAKGEHLSAEARAKYDEQLKAMRASRDAANKKLQEMRAASESAWQQMQVGVDTAWASMKNALDKASSGSSRSRRRRVSAFQILTSKSVPQLRRASGQYSHFCPSIPRNCGTNFCVFPCRNMPRDAALLSLGGQCFARAPRS